MAGAAARNRHEINQIINLGAGAKPLPGQKQIPKGAKTDMIINTEWDKSFRGEVSFAGATFALFFDGENDSVHILDHDLEGTRSVTNAIDDIYEALFIKDEQKPAKIFLYHTDGYITNWDPENSFQTVGPGAEVYEPFAEIAAERKDDFLKEMGF